METNTPQTLTTLSQWSLQHIGSIFEAPSDDDALNAVEVTFAPNVKAAMNGVAIKLDSIKEQVLNLRRTSKRGLRVTWKSLVEVPSDPSNREVRLVVRDLF